MLKRIKEYFSQRLIEGEKIQNDIIKELCFKCLWEYFQENGTYEQKRKLDLKILDKAEKEGLTEEEK